ncbi:unnamed protein product [Rhizophagus irregularis]|nr:unnamed protein product [Rhizophagus irregularis]
MKGLTADQKKLHVKRRKYECTHSGNHVSKKIINLDNQRNRGSYQVNCPWHVNATKPKKENTIGITSVKLEHNHVMNPLIAEMAPKFRKFTSEMITDVEFYVKHSIFSTTQIYLLLRAKYPEHPILKKDLYNIIQKVKVERKEVVKNDSANFLHYLYGKKQQELEWFFEFRLSENDRRLTSLIMILVYEIFESKWKILIEKYSEISKYLKRMLEPTKESWATCYINEIFNCEINSTQRVESLNHLLKAAVQKNFLLYQLANEIQNILDNEMKYERIIKMRNILPRQTLDDVPSKFFVGINEICKEFLIPHILSATQNQMKHSFFYDAYLVDKDTIQQVDNTDDNEGFRKDDYDATQILLQTIIKKIQNLLIVEIWKVQPELSQTKSHFVVLMADGSFSCICNLLISYDSKLNIDDKEIALLDVISIVEDHNSSAVVHEEINFNYVHHVCGEQVNTEKLQGIILAKSKYGKAFGFAKKALDLTQKLDCYNELNGYFKHILKKSNKNYFVIKQLMKILQEINKKILNVLEL